MFKDRITIKYTPKIQMDFFTRSFDCEIWLVYFSVDTCFYLPFSPRRLLIN